jgi:AcrR family transcriptional regulator
VSPAARTPESTRALRASLVAAALRVLDRDGEGGLTMRAVAAEAGVALGLPYKVFASRNELVTEVVAAEFARLQATFGEVVAAAGTGTVAANLARWARALLSSPATALAHEVGHDPELAAAVEAVAGDSGVVVAVEHTVVDYLAAEKRAGRVRGDVDERAFGFLIAGAVHNLLVAGEAYPRPSEERLCQVLEAVAEAVAPAG